MFPLSRADLCRDLCDGRSECGEAVQDGDPDLELGHQTVEVSDRKALNQQLDAVHFGHGPASGVIPAPFSSSGSADALRRTQDFMAVDDPGGVGRPRFGTLAGSLLWLRPTPWIGSSRPMRPTRSG